MSIVSMKELLEAGVHFGHRTPRWHPKMKPFIFTERNGIHIIDLQQTVGKLEEAYNQVRDTVSQGGLILFVGTKKQAAESISAAAEGCGMPYVHQRWLGGTLTNFSTIRRRIETLANLEARLNRGDFAGLNKKEILQVQREIARMNQRLGGLKNMRILPQLLFVVDTNQEAIAVKEANALGIPVVAMVDTNSNPDPIAYPIPSNDDAIRAIKLVATKIADAVGEGKQLWESVHAGQEGTLPSWEVSTGAAPIRGVEGLTKIEERGGEA
ncbi:MAG: 30S ribosomal protein S2 [Chloroflexi bacterium]|nr:30S ribosomal protein S2 [Chloroflexota bacterium]